MTDSQTQRLFVALWPDQTVKAALADIQTTLELGRFGRPIPEDNLHMTLLFLGDVDQSDIDGIGDFVRQMQISPFWLSIDKVGFWPHNKITWAGPTIVNAELQDVVKQVRTGMKKFHRERRNFSAHVTLARKVHRRVSCEIAPIEWHVREICLVRSILTNEGARYKTLARSGRWS